MTCCFIECSLLFPDNLNKDNSDEDSLLGYEKDEDFHTYKCTFSLPRLYRTLRKFKRWLCNKCTSKCVWYMFLFIIFTILVLILVFFVALPLTFKYSVTLQHKLIFSPVVGPSSLYQNYSTHHSFSTYSYFSNHYIVLNKNPRNYLGVWNITGRFNQQKPNILYFHGETGDRRSSSYTYFSSSSIFNVTVFDYRSYGDSSTGDLTEKSLVDDSVQLYKWLQTQSKGDIYIMAEKIGAAIATHVVAKLRAENIIPTGLILVHPFTSLSDKIQEWYWPMGRIFSWMPWYDYMIKDALQQNDLSFNTSDHITKIDCPILIISGRLSFHLPEKLAVIASNREASTQGSTTLENTWWKFGDYCCEDYITEFINECNYFKNNKGKI